MSPSQRPLPDNTQHSQRRDLHAYGGIRNHNPSKTAAADTGSSPRGPWDRQLLLPPRITWKAKFNPHVHKMPPPVSMQTSPRPWIQHLLDLSFVSPNYAYLSKRFLFYVSSYHHPPPPPVLSSSPYISRPSFTTSVEHTYKVW